MRIINYESLQTSNSLAAPLFLRLHLALANVAPENEARFDALFPNFTIEFLHCDRYILRADKETAHIQISTFVLEFLWATAYAHIVFFRCIFQGKDFSKGAELDLTEDPEVAKAMALLRWACTNRVREESAAPPPYVPWPEGFPKPRFDQQVGLDEKVADELALGAAAALLFHELAHLALPHTPPSNIEDEREADAFVWEWILGDRRDYEAPDMKKRLLLLIHAFTSSIVADILAGKLTLDDHPRSIDRLSQLLEKFEVPENNGAYAYGFATLYLHAANSEKVQIPPQLKAYDSFLESFDQTIDHISRLPTEFGAEE